MVNKATDNWSGKTDGTPWMLRSLVVMFHWIDVRVFYCIMGMVIPFYMLFCRQGYLSSYHYLRRRFGDSPLKAFFKVYKHQFTFGEIILDRFAVYAGKSYEIDIDGVEHFNELSAGEPGFMMLSSHVGSYELAGYHLVSKNKRIHALVYGGESEAVMENRRKIFADKNLEMVIAKQDMSHIFALNNALAEGNIVSMPGDRTFGSQRAVDCDFLGAKAKFPLGPYAMAAQRDLPILAIFVMKDSVKHYTIYVRRIDCPANQPRIKQKAETMAKDFAVHLDWIIRKYPLQWFNFYDFWGEDAAIGYKENMPNGV